MKKIAEMTLDEIHKLNIDNFSPDQVMDLSKRFADLQYGENRMKIDCQARDWSSVPDETGWICGVNGEAIHVIPYLTIKKYDNAIVIHGWHSGDTYDFEIFRSREKLNSFIDALVEARETAFGA